MSTVTTALSTIYDEFLTKGLEKLHELQKETEMENEFLATASSNIIVGAMQNSTQAYESLKRGLLIDKQIVTETNKALDIVSTTTVRNAHSTQDILNKQKQVELISQQVLKLTEDTAFVGEQKTQLTASVGFNNKLKTLNSYGNMNYGCRWTCYK